MGNWWLLLLRHLPTEQSFPMKFPVQWHFVEASSNQKPIRSILKLDLDTLLASTLSFALTLAHMVNSLNGTRPSDASETTQNALIAGEQLSLVSKHRRSSCLGSSGVTMTLPVLGSWWRNILIFKRIRILHIYICHDKIQIIFASAKTKRTLS